MCQLFLCIKFYIYLVTKVKIRRVKLILRYVVFCNTVQKYLIILFSSYEPMLYAYISLMFEIYLRKSHTYVLNYFTSSMINLCTSLHIVYAHKYNPSTIEIVTAANVSCCYSYHANTDIFLFPLL